VSVSAASIRSGLRTRCLEAEGTAAAAARVSRYRAPAAHRAAAARPNSRRPAADETRSFTVPATASPTSRRCRSHANCRRPAAKCQYKPTQLLDLTFL